MTFASSYASIAQSLALAVGLSTVGCATYTGLMPPPEGAPGLTVTGRSDADLAASLRAAIETDYHVSGIQVGSVSSFATQLDGDGLANDFAGSALFQNGRRFRSVIFLMRENGSTRFLEENGARFDPTTGGSLLSCNTKQHLCPDTMERAARQIHGARFRMADIDASRPGLEVVIPYDDGRSGIINSLELFASR